LAVRAGHLAPPGDFDQKIFLSAKGRELTSTGEQKLQDFMLPDYLSLVTEMAEELGEKDIEKIDPGHRVGDVLRLLSERNVLIVIDNVETFPDAELVRLYQFLSRLPTTCKAIVTSRRRADIDARVVRLDRMERPDVLDLLTELAKNNRYLKNASQQEHEDLYEITNGNPLLIKWTVGQLGRNGSQCRSVADICTFLQAASFTPGNDPLEYIFGDLMETFTASETAVMATLAHFSQPARLDRIADLAELAPSVALTALEDLTDRALLFHNESAETFFLPPTAGRFFRRGRSEAIARSATRLTERAYTIIRENGYEQHERFPLLDADWPMIAAAIPLFAAGQDPRLQEVCTALQVFLTFSGREDQGLWLNKRAEEEAVGTGDLYWAGWRAYRSGYIYRLRRQLSELRECVERCSAHWKGATGVGPREQAYAIRLKALLDRLEGNFADCESGSQEALRLLKTIAPESVDVVVILNDLAGLKVKKEDYAGADQDFHEALLIAEKRNYKEGIAYITGNLSQVALHRLDWPAAEKLARDALNLAENVNRQDLIGNDCQRLASALLRLDRKGEALGFARRAVDVFTRMQMKESLLKAESTLKECGD